LQSPAGAENQGRHEHASDFVVPKMLDA
jgi:hypothetical protein